MKMSFLHGIWTRKDKDKKTCVVTGATSGIGFEVARQLVEKGMRIILVGRSDEKCRETELKIRDEFPDSSVQHVVADFSSLQEVRNASKQIKRMLHGHPLDRLVNNAATVSNWYIATEEGYELQFVVNYLSAFLLAHELLPHLSKSQDGKIINVSSGSHRGGRIHWDDMMLRRRYNCLKAYKQSKLALVLFTHEFNRRQGRRLAVRALAIEPGLVNTDLGEKNTGGLVKLYWKTHRKKGISPREAAAAVISLAVGRNAECRDEYWRCSMPIQSSVYSRREDVASQLWKKSEMLAGIESFCKWN